MEITYIDLFGGAGGWDVGLRNAGWKCEAMFDWNESAVKTAHSNFTHPVHVADLTDIDNVLSKGFNPVAVIGSPPCQGFSNEGKKKSDDPRNNLVWKFFDIVEKLKPKVWAFENVPGFRNSYGGKFFKELEKRLDALEYHWDSWILNAADYGVPQFRKRFVAIGGTCFKPQPPESSHAEYEDMLGRKKYVSLWEAISDLPKVECGNRIGIFQYNTPPQNDYQKEMREGSTIIENHTTQNHSERVLEKIKLVKPGQSMEVFVGKYEENKTAYCGGYRRAIKWSPSWTAYWTRGMTSIHPEQDRFFSPRECARIQSFPDNHIFKGTTIENYTQVCNAVPPLLAKAIGIQIAKQLNNC